MAISFTQVPPLRINFLAVEIDASNAQQGAGVQQYRNLVIGQRLSTGGVAALVPTLVTSAEQAVTAFGTGSMLAGQLATILANAPYVETWAIALDDEGSGVAATGSFAFSGTPATGQLVLYIAGTAVKVAVTTGDTADDVATATAAAITANTALPVTASASTNTVTVTARHKGEAGNTIDLRYSYYNEPVPAGLTVTVTAMASGAGNPSLDDVWAAIGDEQYHVITHPYTDAANLTSLETELTDRWSAMRMLDGVAITSARGTVGALTALGDSRNSEHSVIVDAHGSPNTPYIVAAAVAGQVSTAAAIDPARPFQTLQLAGVLPALIAGRRTNSERNVLLNHGIATTTVDAGGVVHIERVITTYKTTANGAADTAYLDLNTLLTLSYLRWDFRNYIRRKYPRHKVADDGNRFGAGQAVITPKQGKAEAVARFLEWQTLGLVENVEQFKRGVICERNAQDPNRLDWLLPPDLINQFRVGGALIQFLL